MPWRDKVTIAGSLILGVSVVLVVLDAVSPAGQIRVAWHSLHPCLVGNPFYVRLTEVSMGADLISMIAVRAVTGRRART